MSGGEGPRFVPPLARRLVLLATPAEDRRYVRADLEERARAVARARGARAARRWCWGQVARAVPLLAGRAARGLTGAGGDLGRTLRTLARRPLYGLGVAGTLALGLGSAAAVGSVAWTVWLAPMPFPDPDRVVRLYEVLPPDGSHASDRVPEADRAGVRWSLSPPVVEDLRRHDWRTLEAVAGIVRDEVDWSRDGERRRLSAVLASPEVGRILGLRPVAGALPSTASGEPEVLLTPDFLERAFGGDPSVVGSTMELDAVAHRVVGVAALPEGYPRAADVLMPLRFREEELVEGMRGARYLEGIARVRPGHEVAEADAEVDAFFQALGEAHPMHRESRGRAVILGDDLVRPYTAVLSLLLVAGGTFLALALVNVAGMVAARKVEVRADRWVRLALGASRGRLLRATLLEGAILGVLAAVGGLLGAYGLLGPVRRLVPHEVPRIAGLGLDPPVAVAVVGCGVAGGLLVALLAHALSGGSDLRAGETRPVRGGSAPGVTGRRLLVVGQVTLTTLLVTGGLTVLHRVDTLRSVELGFDPEGVAGSMVVLGENDFPSDETRGAFWRELQEALEARGWEAAVAVNPPMGGSTMTFGVRRDAASEQTFAQYRSVSPGYFDVMGTRIVEGRVPGAEDGAGDAPVVVLDHVLASRLFPEGGAVGQVLTVVSTPRTVVGVVGPTRHFGPDAEAPPGLYVPLAQDPWLFGHVLVRGGEGDATGVLAEVLEARPESVGYQPPAPYTRHVEAWFAPLRVQTLIVGTLAVVGGLMAALGLHALLAYHVSSRRKEIGIRMALGAPGRKLFRGVVAQGTALAVAGLVLGFGLWYLLLPLTRRFLEGAESGGLLVPAAVAGLVVLSAATATLGPAWRSTGVDPVSTLSTE